MLQYTSMAHEIQCDTTMNNEQVMKLLYRCLRRHIEVYYCKTISHHYRQSIKVSISTFVMIDLMYCKFYIAPFDQCCIVAKMHFHKYASAIKGYPAEPSFRLGKKKLRLTRFFSMEAPFRCTKYHKLYSRHPEHGDSERLACHRKV